MPRNAEPTAGTVGAGVGQNGGRPICPKFTPKPPICQEGRQMLAHALRYALAGWPVFPLQPGGKTPVIPSAHPEGDPLRGKCTGDCGRPGHGVYDATTDPEQIGDWWKRWPNANIGLAIGDDMVVFDVDPRHGGEPGHLIKLGLDMTQAPTQRTWRDGWHVAYRKPHTIDLAAHVANLPGLDVISGARYIVAAPSVIEGRQYRWERHPLDVDPPRLPLEIAERLRKRAPVAPAPSLRTTSASTPAGDAPPLHVLEHALAHLDPWSFTYDTWVGILMSLHSAYPGADGLALAEAWGDGKDGEIASKWAGFDQNGGITYGLILREAKARGWRPELAGDEAPTMDAAHRVLHETMEHAGGDCPICGKSFFETAVVGNEVRGRRRVMMCHRRDCLTWQTHKTEKQIMERRPWEWSAWFASEHTPDEWRRLVNGPLAERADWLGAPLIGGNIALFAGFAVRPTAVSVSLRTLLEMAAERILAIPEGKRLRKAKVKARAKRVQAETQAEATIEASSPEPVAEAGPRLRWTRWAFGVDLLSAVDAWTILAIIERAGGTVEPDGTFRYPLAIDGKVRAAVAAWDKPARPEISAYIPPAENASISPAPPLPQQPGYLNMPDRQRKQARKMLLEDTERAYRQRESLARA